MSRHRMRCPRGCRLAFAETARRRRVPDSRRHPRWRLPASQLNAGKRSGIGGLHTTAAHWWCAVAARAPFHQSRARGNRLLRKRDNRTPLRLPGPGPGFGLPPGPGAPVVCPPCAPAMLVMSSTRACQSLAVMVTSRRPDLLLVEDARRNRAWQRDRVCLDRPRVRPLAPRRKCRTP